MKFLAFFATAFLVFVTPLAASAQQDYTWVYDRFDGAGAFDNSLTLVYGVPETDDIQFLADCVVGANGPFVSVLMRANIGQMTDGTPAEVHISGDNGYVQRFDATAVQYEEFLYGVEFRVATNDRYLDALASQNSLIYAVPGHQAHDLGLRGSAGPVRRFASECSALPTPRNNGKQLVAMPKQASGKTSDYGCDQHPYPVSQNSNTPQTATFTNYSGGYRVVMWLDFQGNPVDYASLNDGESFSVNSYLTHPWMITDGPGNCLEVIHLEYGVSNYALTAPDQYFGDE